MYARTVTDSARVIRLRPDNLIPRPWGGVQLAAFKGLSQEAGSGPIGESFEVCAFPDDAEAGAHPSIAILETTSSAHCRICCANRRRRFWVP